MATRDREYGGGVCIQVFQVSIVVYKRGRCLCVSYSVRFRRHVVFRLLLLHVEYYYSIIFNLSILAYLLQS